jgi:hypothetical protein
MLRMPAAELPADVLTELGRVTWAAINLENDAKMMCWFIQPSNPRTDRRQLSKKIKAAKKVLESWPPDRALAGEATEWLERARLAIERRNAALHATPLVWIEAGSPRQYFLGEMPRHQTPYTERPLTVESLAELRAVLDSAADGWRDLILAIGEATRSAPPPGLL